LGSLVVVGLFIDEVFVFFFHWRAPSSSHLRFHRHKANLHSCRSYRHFFYTSTEWTHIHFCPPHRSQHPSTRSIHRNSLRLHRHTADPFFKPFGTEPIASSHFDPCDPSSPNRSIAIDSSCDPTCGSMALCHPVPSSLSPFPGIISNKCWTIKEIYLFGETDQFIRNYKHCSAASYCCGIFWSLPCCWLSYTSSYPQVHTCSLWNTSCTSNSIMHALNGRLHQKCPLTGLDETKISLKVDRRHSTCFALNLIASTTCTNVVQTAVWMITFTSLDLIWTEETNCLCWSMVTTPNLHNWDFWWAWINRRENLQMIYKKLIVTGFDNCVVLVL